MNVEMYSVANEWGRVSKWEYAIPKDAEKERETSLISQLRQFFSRALRPKGLRSWVLHLKRIGRIFHLKDGCRFCIRFKQFLRRID